MATVHVRYPTTLSAASAFTAVTDWSRHRVPLTSIEVTPAGFTARTGVGRWGFDDPMEITLWDPPRRVDLRKTGRVVRGTASIDVVEAPTGAVVTWNESVTIIGVPRWCDPLVRPALRAMVSLVLRRLLG